MINFKLFDFLIFNKALKNLLKSALQLFTLITFDICSIDINA